MDQVLNPTALFADLRGWFTPVTSVPPTQAVARSAVRPDTSVRKLARSSLVSISNPKGQEVWCVQGTLWITQDGDSKDHIVEAGNGFVADHSTPLTFYALSD
jgi:hypothetical protein